ncbi:MAG TPA: CHAT domain-containing protein, partial [Bryobacteraceae bacterium]|nr:CHAT domain-containing protein [Bryobacteraceae bacterium]
MSAVHSLRRRFSSQPLKVPYVMLRIVAGLAVTLIAGPSAWPADDIGSLTKEAERLAWLKNWTRAEPLYAKIEAHHRERGDARNALFAEISRLRGQLPTLSLIATSGKLADWLEHPLVQNDAPLRLRCLTVKGDVDMDIDSDLARRDWQEAKDLSHELGDAAWENRATGELGIIAFLQGDSGAAVMMVGQALKTAQTLGDVAAQVRYLALIGSGMSRFGDTDRGLAMIDKAIALSEATEGLGIPFLAYSQRAGVLIRMNRLREAEDLLRRTGSMAESKGSIGYQADVLIELAKIYTLQDRTDDARTALLRASDLARSVDGHRLASIAEFELSKIAVGRRDYSAAEHHAFASVSEMKKAGDVYLLPSHMAQQAVVLAAQGRASEADAVFDAATDIVEAMLVNVANPNARSGLLTAMERIYTEQFRLHARPSGKLSKAFHVIEKARGRSISDLMGTATLRGNTARLTAAERRLSKLQLQLISTSSTRQRKRLLNAILEAEQDLSPMIAAVNRTRMRSQREPVELSTLQRSLRPDELFVEYLVSEPESFALVISRRTAIVHALPGSAALSKTAERFGNSLRTSFDEQLARTLFRDLIPFAASSRARRLIIVPDAFLHQLPFEALYMADGPVVNTHVVSSVPSATVWAAARLAGAQPRSGFAVLAVGAGPSAPSATAVKTPPINRALFDFDGSSLPELRSANTEARMISQLFGAGGTVLVGENATEVEFKALPLRRFTIMHFATHGVTSRKFPDRSALVLHAGSGGTSEDGLLQAREIANLALSAELVTLSACQTASGRVLGTEGIANL